MRSVGVLPAAVAAFVDVVPARTEYEAELANWTFVGELVALASPSMISAEVDPRSRPKLNASATSFFHEERDEEDLVFWTMGSSHRACNHKKWSVGEKPPFTPA